MRILSSGQCGNRARGDCVSGEHQTNRLGVDKMSRVRTLASGGEHNYNSIEAIAEIVLNKRETTALTRSSPTLSALRDHYEDEKTPPSLFFNLPAASVWSWCNSRAFQL